jgi:hypothetical protein
MQKAGFNRENGGQLEGRYVNYFEIGHNACEFILDFGQLFSEDQEAGIHTRLVTNPAYARELAAVLNGALSQYEQNYGSLPDRAESGKEYGKAPGKNKRRTSALKIV